MILLHLIPESKSDGRTHRRDTSTLTNPFAANHVYAGSTMYRRGLHTLQRSRTALAAVSGTLRRNHTAYEAPFLKVSRDLYEMTRRAIQYCYICYYERNTAKTHHFRSWKG